MKYLNWAFVLALTVAAVLFALSNMNVVDLRFWPVPYSVSLPVFAWVMIAFVIGFFCGGFVVWTRNVSARHRERAAERHPDARTQGAAPQNRQPDTRPASSSESTAVVPSR
jgi:uncharacterized integral membrane protein